MFLFSICSSRQNKRPRYESNENGYYGRQKKGGYHGKKENKSNKNSKPFLGKGRRGKNFRS